MPAVPTSSASDASITRRQIWLDGDWIPWEEATVHVLSHSLQRGSLIFDYMSVHETPRGPAVFRLPEHVARFQRSAEMVGLPLGHDAPALEAAILETVRRNPGALARENIRLLTASGKQVNPLSVNWSAIRRIPYRLRQDTGARNALGRIKFMFPNKFNVYIHDTPSKSLFARESRYFSHGCMRLQYPEQLASVLLGSQGWTPKKIAGQIASGKRRIVKLKKHIPVHVTYLTSWANKDSTVHFRDDIYGRDKILIKAMGL